MPLKTRRWLLLFSAIAFMILVPLVLLYTAGYRLDDGWQLKKTGGLYIHSPISGSEIYLNNDLQKVTNILQTGVFVQSLKPTKYKVLVAKEDYWPWEKNITVRSEIVTEGYAFLIPRSPDGHTVLRGYFSTLYGSITDNVLIMEELNGGKKRLAFYLPDGDRFISANSTSTAKILANYNDIKNIYSENGNIYLENNKGGIIQISFDLGGGLVSAKYISKIPEDLTTANTGLEAPAHLIKYDSRKRLRLYAQGNVIFADWLSPDLPLPYFLQTNQERIVSARSAIRALAFYPNRRDVLIYAEGTGIYATELDARGGRNTQPIYKGSEPTFAIFPGDKKIYILDNNVLMVIELP